MLGPTLRSVFSVTVLWPEPRRLSIELRTRSDLALVERAARERLQMTPPDPRQIRRVTLAAGTPTK